MIHYVHYLDFHLFLTHHVYKFKSAIAGQTDKPNELIFLMKPMGGYPRGNILAKKFENSILYTGTANH